MNKPKLMDVKDIHIVNRYIDNDPDVPWSAHSIQGLELADHIARHGQKQPVLVDSDMNLIDGLRRIEAVGHNGGDQITVLVCDTLEETAKALNKTRLHGVLAQPYGPRRIWEIYLATHEQMGERSRRMRQRRVGIPKSQPLPPIERSRQMLCEAMGFKGDSLLAAVTALYQKFESNTDPALTNELYILRQKLESGDKTIYEIRGAVDRLGKNDLGGDITNARDQRDAIATALAGLSGAMKGLSRLGEIDSELSQAELEMYVKGFEAVKRDLYRFVVSLRKRANR